MSFLKNIYEKLFKQKSEGAPKDPQLAEIEKYRQKVALEVFLGLDSYNRSSASKKKITIPEGLKNKPSATSIYANRVSMRIFGKDLADTNGVLYSQKIQTAIINIYQTEVEKFFPPGQNAAGTKFPDKQAYMAEFFDTLKRFEKNFALLAQRKGLTIASQALEQGTGSPPAVVFSKTMKTGKRR